MISKSRNAESVFESDLALGGGQGKLLSDAGKSLPLLIEAACVHCLDIIWIQFRALLTPASPQIIYTVRYNIFTCTCNL